MNSSYLDDDGLLVFRGFFQGVHQLAQILGSWQELMEGALACRAGMSVPSPLARSLSQSRSSQELMAAMECLKKAAQYTQGNVSPAAVCGWLEWALR